MKIIDVIQGTHEWHTARLKMLTGTRIKELAKTDNLPLVDELIVEFVTETINNDGYVSEDMQRGSDMEPIARAEYIKETGNIMNEYGFCVSEKYEYLGISPDGFTEDLIGGLEIKCPATKTHVKYIRQNKVPAEYKYQVQNYFLVNPLCQWVDFVSFDPRFTIKPLHIVTTYRKDIEDELIATEAMIVKFWDKFTDYYNQILF